MSFDSGNKLVAVCTSMLNIFDFLSCQRQESKAATRVTEEQAPHKEQSSYPYAQLSLLIQSLSHSLEPTSLTLSNHRVSTCYDFVSTSLGWWDWSRENLRHLILGNALSNLLREITDEAVHWDRLEDLIALSVNIHLLNIFISWLCLIIVQLNHLLRLWWESVYGLIQLILEVVLLLRLIGVTWYFLIILNLVVIFHCI